MNLIHELNPEHCIENIERSMRWTGALRDTPSGVRTYGSGYLSLTFGTGRPTRRRRTGEARADAYPEDTNYKDEGCDLAPSCLDCPFAHCRYDDAYKKFAQSIRRDARAEAVIVLVSDGKSAAAAARKVGISLRAAMRYVSSAGGVAAIRSSKGAHSAA